MVKLESLKKSNQFRKALKEKKFIQIITPYLLPKTFSKLNTKLIYLLVFCDEKKNW